MIETEHTILIGAAIDGVWGYVSDIRNWAALMPGYRDCTIIDANDSRWTLKVGVGGLVRTVNVLVHVERWDGPERVTFTYTLEGDPVAGGGTYLASRRSAHETEVALRVRVEGSGAMAPMWEAMGRPLMPQFVKSFAEQLKAEIEKPAGAGAPQNVTAPAPSFLAIPGRWMRRVWRAMFGSKKPGPT